MLCYYSVFCKQNGTRHNRFICCFPLQFFLSFNFPCSFVGCFCCCWRWQCCVNVCCFQPLEHICSFVVTCCFCCSCSIVCIFYFSNSKDRFRSVSSRSNSSHFANKTLSFLFQFFLSAYCTDFSSRKPFKSEAKVHQKKHVFRNGWRNACESETWGNRIYTCCTHLNIIALCVMVLFHSPLHTILKREHT